MLRLPERIHKRPFVVSISVLITLLVLSGVLVLTLSLFGPGSDLMRVHVSAKVTGSGNAVDGIGINLPYIPTANLLKNPSFENTQYDKVYTVSGGADNAVYVQSDSTADSIYTDDFFVGGTVRIMSLDQDGQLVPKMQADITDFKINQLGLWTPLTVPSGAAEGQKVRSLSSSSAMSVAVGEKGLLISDIASSNPEIIDLGVSGNFVSSSCIADRFYAVTDTGSFASSADGKTWNIFDPAATTSFSINTVSSLGKIGIAAGDSGAILLCSNGVVSSVSSGTTNNLLTSAGDGTSIVIAGMNGSVITTSNGVIYRALSTLEMPSFTDTPNWQCSDYRDGYFIMGGDLGQIAIGSFSTDTGLFSFVSHQAADESGIPLSVLHVLMLSTGEIIIMDSQGLLYCSSDRGDTWQLLSVNTMKAIDEIGQTATGKILLSQGVTSQTTQLFTRIQFDDVQSDNVFLAGDMCFLQKNVTSQEEQASGYNQWEGMGEGTTMTMQPQAPSGGGSSSLHLVGSEASSGDQSHYISQIISSGSDAPLQKSTLYQIKVWLKQDGISNSQVMAWISGKFASSGTVFTDVGSSWRQYTYTFFLPPEATGLNPGEIRLNIGFTGSGVMDMDKAYFGLESNADSSIPDSFAAPVSASSPNLIRLENIGFGQMGVSSQAWLLSSGNEGLLKADEGFTAAGCNSLDASLKLVHDAGSDPWLVIGSAANQTTVDSLMAYLCGSITDPFGKLRIENGTAVPWSITFSRIVIEISDSDKIFSTDLQRGAYVDYMINLFQSSSYYVDNKDEFTFLDGMVYDGGTMLSEADFHASSLTITNQKQTADGITAISFGEAVSAGYTSYYDLIPRTPSRPQQDADEWIRSSSLTILKSVDEQNQTNTSAVVTAAGCVQVLLSDLGGHTSNVLPDLEVSQNGADAGTVNLFANEGSTKAEKLLSAQNNKTMLAVCTLLTDSVNGLATEVSLIPSIESVTQNSSVETENNLKDSGLIMYGFKYLDKIRTIVANTSDQPVLFLLEADWSLKDVYVYTYSSEGLYLEKTKLGQRNNRINLLPGQVIVAEIPVK